MNQTIFLLILLYLAKRNGCIGNAQFCCLAALLAVDSGCLGSLLASSSDSGGCNCNCNSCCN